MPIVEFSRLYSVSSQIQNTVDYLGEAWDISGMHSPEDFVEFSARVRHEHSLRGYECLIF